MFTGLIEDVGHIAAIDRKSSGYVIRFQTGIPTSELAIGDSVACNGVCLTVVSKDQTSFCADVSHETLARSSFNSAKTGMKVNFERALALGDRLGGHLVAGHVDGIGKITKITDRGDSTDYEITIPADQRRYVIDKGSITIDGISLTVNRKLPNGVLLTIIPHTKAQTTLAVKKMGDEVNIETDMIGKYVESLFDNPTGSAKSLKDRLAENGFIR